MVQAHIKDIIRPELLTVNNEGIISVHDVACFFLIIEVIFVDSDIVSPVWDSIVPLRVTDGC